MRIIIQGNWGPTVGTDYCDALGIYDSLEDKDARVDAEDYAWNLWVPDEDLDDGCEDEGPDFWLEEYDPEKHDNLRAGGGSFEAEFKEMENGL